MVPRIATIGVYGFTAESFLATLLEHGVTELWDIRQRRGVRGSEYAWANAQRLQNALAEAGIAYRHLPELAPTTELRGVQYAEDAAHGVGKRDRQELSPAFAERYRSEILARAEMPEPPARGLAALFCVERDPEACHRSLVAAATRADVVDLRPG